MAEQIGCWLAQRNIIVVTGARTGVMEAVSKGAHQYQGAIHGVMRKPNSYCNDFVTHRIICDPTSDMSYELSLNIRTGKLLESDGFVVFLGETSGKGTHKELCAVVECEVDNWQPKRPCAVIFTNTWHTREVADCFGINRQDEAYMQLIETKSFEGWLRLFDTVSEELINFVTGQSG